jgi:hypothetical protein
MAGTRNDIPLLHPGQHPLVPRQPIPKSECRLLSRADARRYCGGLGDERFDREVAPYCVPRLIGLERFYDRLELDSFVDRLGSAEKHEPTDWLDRVERDLDQSSRR